MTGTAWRAREIGGGAPNPAAPKPRCRKHEWRQQRDLAGDILSFIWVCRRCGRLRDEARARIGRNNRSRGLAIQRQRNAGLGLTNIAGNAPGHDGGKHDEPFATESKSGPGAFSSRYWKWLSAIPAEAGQVRLLIVTDTPGPGHRARSYVVVEYGDWRALSTQLAILKEPA